jgi:deoxyribodipyrimidine photolyase-related protein
MEATVIFPHQLFRPHPAVQSGRRIWLIEDPLFFGSDRYWPLRVHWQRLLLHRSSLQAFAEELRAAGHDPVRVSCPAEPSTTGEVLAAALPKEVTSLHVVDPVDDVLSRRLVRWTHARQIALVVTPSPNFLTPLEQRHEHFGGGRKPFMARFYAQQRQRLKLLLEPDGSPRGGRWSFDEENRRKLNSRVVVPAPPHAAVPASQADIRAALAKEFPHAPGGFGPGLYPVTRRAARIWLDDFLTWRLAGFGPYEDAISSIHPVLFHSVLTPLLNIGLLNPATVVERAIAAAEEQSAPLASIEGFVRQVVGWREFMRAAYEQRGVAMRRGNFWGFTRRMPAAFYTASTGIAPVDHVIRGVLATGYCHHIERLMVLGNFFLLCRIHPDDVYRWFMELFVDAYDWVMVPNVYGMSQFADGGSFTTKPYLSASSYLLKMSDFSRGDWCETWDALFWTFVADYKEVFRDNPRLAPMAWGLQRQEAKMPAHRRRADHFLATLG